MPLGEASGYELVSLVSAFLLSERDFRSVIPDVSEMLLKNLSGRSVLLYGLVHDGGRNLLRLDFAESLRGSGLAPYSLATGQGLAGRIAESGSEFFSPALDDEALAGDGELAAFARGQACFGFPLVTREHLQSVLLFLFDPDVKLPPRELLSAIAHLIANYLGSVQLRRDLFRTRKKFSLLNNYKKVFSGTLDLRPVLSVFMNITASALSAEVGIFLLFREGTLQPEMEINWGVSYQDLAQLVDGNGRNLMQLVLGSRDIVHIANYSEEAPAGEKRTQGGVIKSLLAGALFVQQNPVGLIMFANKSTTGGSQRTTLFDYEDSELFEVMRDQVSNSVENYYLYRKVIEIKNFNENVLESIQSAVISIDLDGRVLSYNRRAREIACVDADCVGRHVSLMLPLDFFAPDKLAAMIAGGGFPDKLVELELQRADDTLILGVLLSPLAGDQARPVGVVVTVEDMTERRMLERRMARTEQLAALGELSAGLAHELRNPLTAMKGFTQLLPQRMNDVEFLEKYSRVIANEINRLNDLIERLLVFARPNIGEFRATDIRKIIDDSMMLLRYQFEKNGVICRVNLTPGLPRIRCNESRLTQVFLNIMINAMQSMTDGGTLEVSVSEGYGILSTKKRTHILVTEFVDNGAGIAPSEINRIFNPFYTTKESGTGLGLSISFRIVEEHSGVIEVESVKGRGTTMRVLLPALEAEDA